MKIKFIWKEEYGEAMKDMVNVTLSIVFYVIQTFTLLLLSFTRFLRLEYCWMMEKRPSLKVSALQEIKASNIQLSRHDWNH